MRIIHVSPEFTLNRRMRKAVRRGKLQVVREDEENLSLGGDQAVDAFVSAFAAKTRGIPEKLAACGAMFVVGARAKLGLKVLLLSPPGSGKTLLCDLVCPLTEAKGMGLANITPKNLQSCLKELSHEGCSVFVHDHASTLNKGCAPVLAEWDGSVLLCAIPAEIRGRPYPGFVRVEVSQEESKADSGAFAYSQLEDDSPDELEKSASEGKDSRLRELREKLQGLPRGIDKNSLLRKIREL